MGNACRTADPRDAFFKIGKLSNNVDQETMGVIKREIKSVNLENRRNLKEHPVK